MMARNQCDGCARDLPTRRGVHEDRGRAVMLCTAYRYAEPPERDASFRGGCGMVRIGPEPPPPPDGETSPLPARSPVVREGRVPVGASCGSCEHAQDGSARTIVRRHTAPRRVLTCLHNRSAGPTNANAVCEFYCVKTSIVL